MRRKRIAVAVAAGVVAVAAITLPPSTTSAPATDAVVFYTVKTGDTWTGITRAFCGTATGAQVQAFSRYQPGTLTIGRGVAINPANCGTTPTTTSTTTTTTTAPPPTTVPVDLSAWIIPGGTPAPTSNGEGSFRFTCGMSHLAYDDPIVKPNQPGASHLHMFFGNPTVNAATSYDTLRAAGVSSCDGGPVNRSGYWVPAFINGPNVQVPDAIAVYYKSFAQTAQTVAPPVGLRMIAGADPTNPTGTAHHFFYCGGEIAELGGQVLKDCPTGELLARVVFPECWDGINLDSVNHRSHLAYAADLGGVCGGTYPVRIPEVTYTFVYSNAQAASGWRLSSDMPGMVAGSSLHGDWFGGWGPTVLSGWVQTCIVEQRDCQGGQLGDGRVLRGYGFDGSGRYQGWPGPWQIPTPTNGAP
jgi:hypothetical protein